MIKAIPNYEGYFVDEEGNVYSNKKGELKQLKAVKLRKILWD
jgi:hypothetical protein